MAPDITLIIPGIAFAGKQDVPALIYLLNKAYRGKLAEQGWTSEAHLITGEKRTSDSSVLELFDKPGNVFLKYTDEQDKLIGCVNLQQEGEQLYLGMLSVDPELQNAGIGKKLLQASESYAKQVGCKRIYMTVISLRDLLIEWYKRHGYSDTGKREPFIENIEESGRHLQPLEFMVMEKMVGGK